MINFKRLFCKHFYEIEKFSGEQGSTEYKIHYKCYKCKKEKIKINRPILFSTWIR